MGGSFPIYWTRCLEIRRSELLGTPAELWTEAHVSMANWLSIGAQYIWWNHEFYSHFLDQTRENNASTSLQAQLNTKTKDPPEAPLDLGTFPAQLEQRSFGAWRLVKKTGEFVPIESSGGGLLIESVMGDDWKGFDSFYWNVSRLILSMSRVTGNI